MRFGKLTAIKESSREVRGSSQYWHCVCDCNNEKYIEILKKNLLSGNSKSCGCETFRFSETHGMSNSITYRSWKAMFQRCTNPNHKKYKDYGGKGIKICDRWRSFENFLEDVGERPSSKYTLDRINNKGHYEPANCKWETVKNQNRNKRNNFLVEIEGEVKTITDWAIAYKINPNTVFSRLFRGWTPKEALLTPLLSGGRKLKRIGDLLDPEVSGTYKDYN